MAKILLLLILCMPSWAEIQLNFSEVKPKVTKDIVAYREKLRKKHGLFKTFSKVKEYLRLICSSEYVSNRADFEPEQMFSFVVEQNGQVLAAVNRENGKKVKHLDLGKVLIGGGEIKCLKSGLIHITNRSAHYCFPFEPLYFLVKKMLKAGQHGDKIILRYKTKKMCAEKKQKRLRKYQQIIGKKYLDLGYKKNHHYTATEFIRRVESKQ